MRTYRAILRGNRVEWRGDEPNPQQSLEVDITVLEQPHTPEENQQKNERIASLQQLAEKGGISNMTDASEWQRKERQDRPRSG